jgi:hypothetical protein
MAEIDPDIAARLLHKALWDNANGHMEEFCEYALDSVTIDGDLNLLKAASDFVAALSKYPLP